MHVSKPQLFTQTQITNLYYLPLRLAGYLHTVFLAVVLVIFFHPDATVCSRVYDHWFTPMCKYYLVLWGIQFIYFMIVRGIALYNRQQTHYPADVFCLSLVYYTVLAFEVTLWAMIQGSFLKIHL